MTDNFKIYNTITNINKISSGFHKIWIKEIKYILPIIIDDLKNEINDSLSNGKYPESLKTIQITPV